METVFCAIDEISIPKGRRRANEDQIKELAESIAEIGQLQPILVRKNRNGKLILVGGLHRLKAFHILGRTEILATVTELSSVDSQLAEIDENLVRFELSAAERAKLTVRRKKIYIEKYPQTKQGGSPGKAGGGKVALSKKDNVASFDRDTAGKSGKSPRSVRRDANRGEKIDQEVLDIISGSKVDTGKNLDFLAKLPKERQREIVEYAEDKGIVNLSTAKKRSEKDEAIETIKDEPQPLPDGPYRVIVSDPPWPYDYVEGDHRGAIKYHSMSIQDICELGVQDVAHKNCILWLWTTNSFMHEAYHVVSSWGFSPKTILTWKKPHLGVGNWLRNITEHCIVAVRGKPVVDLTNQTTFLEAPAREHSRKPDEFYELVESLCPGAKLEMFARETREGWSGWGSETGKFDEIS